MKHAVSVAAVVAALLLSRSAMADGGFDVRPTVIETDTGSAEITVDNPNDHRIYLATTILSWSKDGTGNERLRESETAMASPPATWVAPHSSYTVRIQVPPATMSTERAYRLMIRQVPDRDEIAAGRIVFAVTQNLPVFSEPIGMRPPALSARIGPEGTLLVVNSGGRHVRIEGIRQDSRVLASGLVTYALADSISAVRLGQPVHPGQLEIDTPQGQRLVDIP